MTKIDSIMNSPHQFNAITGLRPNEFMNLLYHSGCCFAPIVEEYYRHRDMKGHRREVTSYQERSNSGIRCSLSGSVNKLFFILSYLKENSNQGYHGIIFSISQGRVSLWVIQLFFWLEQALNQMDKMPKCEIKKFCNFFCLLWTGHRSVIMFMATARTWQNAE